MVERRRQAARGALLGTILGDALGAPFEGAPPLADGADPRRRVDAALERGTLPYTDDTQLTLALARHLVQSPLVEPEGLRDAFLDDYEDWRGYGAGMRRLVDHWRSTGAPLDEAARAVFPDGSLGNGAAMRVAPVGVRWAHDEEQLAEVAARSARVTHVHPIGVDGAICQARAVAAATTDGFGHEQVQRLADRAAATELREGLRTAARLARQHADAGGPLPWRRLAHELGVEVVAHRSVPAALFVAAVVTSVEQAIVLALGLGGDTDTIAAMGAAVRGAADGVEAVPQTWVSRMERGPRGWDGAEELARRLADRA